MIRINLLPLSERQSKWPINKILLTGSILVALVCCSIYSYNVFTIWSLEKRLQNTYNQYELLQPTVEIMRTANSKQQMLDRKENILAALTSEHNSWHLVMQHLVTLAPQQMWFTDICKTDKGVIQIKGVAKTYSVVTEFMQILEQDELFSEPILIQDESDIASEVIKFEIMVKSKGM